MFHLRFTPYDISGYTFNFLEKFESYILARELLDDNLEPLLHYHILIGTTYGDKSIRDSAKTELKIPKGGKGRNNKYYALMEDWKDPSYIVKYYDVLGSKGYTDKQILDYAVEGKQKYLDKAKVEKNLNVPEPKSPPKIPYQQAVLTDAAADWYNYKKECRDNNERVVKQKVCEFVCDSMVKVSKGINPYLVKELSYAILYQDLDFKNVILAKIAATL